MADHPPIVIATTNPAKAAKLRWVLDGLPVTPIDPGGEPGFRAPSETGETYAENACTKAVQASRAAGGLAIASDGGVQVPALGEAWNGLLTGRAAGDDVEEEMRARHLLLLMQGKTGEERRVLWTEAVAVAGRGVLLGSWQESGNQGLLTEEYDAADSIPGFWVYSLWFYPEVGKRYCELTQDELERVDLTWGRVRERVREFFGRNPPIA